MLGSLRKLLGADGAARTDWSDVEAWAQAHAFSFRRVKDDAGFVVDGATDGAPWRMEWGPSQRDFIGASELRFRCDVSLPPDMQLLILTRPLMEQLDARLFEEQVQGTQTRIDGNTPEELRWLVMFRPVDLTPFRAVRARFGAVASAPEAGFAWIEGDLARALERAGETLLPRDPPLLVMTHRGKVYLRLGTDEPDAVVLGEAAALFDCAVRQALRAAHGRGAGGEWPASGSTAWQNVSDGGPESR